MNPPFGNCRVFIRPVRNPMFACYFSIAYAAELPILVSEPYVLAAPPNRLFALLAVPRDSRTTATFLPFFEVQYASYSGWLHGYDEK